MRWKAVPEDAEIPVVVAYMADLITVISAISMILHGIAIDGGNA